MTAETLVMAAAAAIVAAAVTFVVVRRAAESARVAHDAEDRRQRDMFQALAAEALRTNNASFLTLAKESLGALQRDAARDLDTRQRRIDDVVQPVITTLKDVNQRLEQAERERVRLMDSVATLAATTITLSRALRSPTVRGRWGEMQLRRVVELAGMLEHCDFDEQSTISSAAGRFRPDLIVHLPGGKQIVVDAKAPLDAFLDAQELSDDDARAAKLSVHARQVRDHVERLSAKSYWEQLESSPEMVVLFLPGETLFAAALQHDLTLIDYGLQKKVLLASPITLIALLTTVAHTWRQERLAESYREVKKLGSELYDRVAKFAYYFDDLRKRLDGAVHAYNDAVGSLESRVLVSARRLKDLEVTTKEDIPPAEAIDTVPRVLKQAGLMGLPEEATTPDDEEFVRS